MKVASLLKLTLTSLLIATTILAGSALAADVTGFVTYSGATPGQRIYITLQSQYGLLGTSVPYPGPDNPQQFVIRGVPAGYYSAEAFLDNKDTGSRHATDPSGQTSIPFQVLPTDISVDAGTITLAEPAAITAVPAPTGLTVSVSGNGSAIVDWDTDNTNQAEFADVYNLYWSTSPGVGPGVTTGGGSKLGIAANGNSGVILNGLPTGVPLYFALTAQIATMESPASTPVSVTIAPSTGYTLSGTVNYPTLSAAAPLYVVLVDKLTGTADKLYLSSYSAPAGSTSTSFSVSNVPTGTYMTHAVLDINNSGVVDIGDWATPEDMSAIVTVNGANLTQNFTITNVNAAAQVRTGHIQTGASDMYMVGLDVMGISTRPVSVTLTGVPASSGITVPMDLGSQGWGFFAQIPTTAPPVTTPVPDTYTFEVTDSLGTPTTITASVTDVMTGFATPLGPIGSIAYDGTPTFTWSLPTPAPYGIGVSVYGNNNGTSWTSALLPGTGTSAPYNFDGSEKNNPSLPVGGSFTWGVYAQSLLGNYSYQEANFNFPEAGLSIMPATPVLPAAKQNVPYTLQFTASGGSIYDWSTLTGTLPGGLFLDPSTGMLSGTATEAGNFSFTVQAVDVLNPTFIATRAYALNVEQTGSISGTVTDFSTGFPLTGITATVVDSATGLNAGSALTDASGVYTISGLAAGSYQILFSGSVIYANQWYNGKMWFTAADPVIVAGSTVTGINAALDHGGSISGTVTPATSGILVIAHDFATNEFVGSAYTGITGDYTIYGLPAGSYRIEFRAGSTGYANQWYLNETVPSQAVVVPVTADQTTSGINAMLQPGGSISGTVTDSSNGSAVQGVYVNAYNATSNTYAAGSAAATDANGSYTISALPPGDYKIEFDASFTTYISEWHLDKKDVSTALPVTVNGATVTVNATLTRGGKIQGRVLNSGGAGIADIYVHAFDAGTGSLAASSSATLTDGIYTIAGLPQGTYKLQFDAYYTTYLSEWYNDKLAATADPIAVTSGMITPMPDTQLASGAVITGALTNGTSTIAGIQVNAYDISGVLTGNATTDAGGKYRLQGLLAGTYKLEFDASFSPYESQWYNNKSDSALADPLILAPGETKPSIDALLAPDTTAPDVALSGTPATVTNQTTATFTFSSADIAATFQCSLDGSAFSLCHSPASYPALSAGTHTFEVKAVDFAGNVTPTPASFSWLIDTSLLTVSLTTTANGPTNAPFQVTAVFSKPVTGFTASGMTVTNATVSNFSGSGTTYVFNAVPTATGSVTIAVPAGTVFDAAGNGNSASNQLAITADLIPPVVTITGMPFAFTSGMSAVFSFSSSKTGSTFQCSLDNSTPVPCGSGVSYSSLTPDSTHNFSVTATDAAGNSSQAATYVWTIDTIPPNVVLGTTPVSLSKQTTATFIFSSAEPAATFQCSLDGASFSPCSSGITYPALSDGNHLFEVLSTDPAGNVSPTPAQFGWTIDATPPSVSITSPRTGSASNTTPLLSYVSSDGTVTVKLDGTIITTANNTSLATLPDGLHSIIVAAADSAGNIGTSSVAFTVDTKAPDVTITGKPAALTTQRSATMIFSSTDSTALFRCSLDDSPFAACTSGISYTSLAPTAHSFKIEAVDPAGNATQSSYSWTVDLKSDGDLTPEDGLNGTVTIADALKALRVAVGEITASPEEVIRGDVAPLVNGYPQPDGKIDVGDAVVLLRRVVGLVKAW